MGALKNYYFEELCNQEETMEPDLLELELDNTLRDLKGYILQAESNPSRFTPHYYELISQISNAADKLAGIAAGGEMPENPAFGADL